MFFISWCDNPDDKVMNYASQRADWLITEVLMKWTWLASYISVCVCVMIVSVMCDDCECDV